MKGSQRAGQTRQTLQPSTTWLCECVQPTTAERIVFERDAKLARVAATHVERVSLFRTHEIHGVLELSPLRFFQRVEIVGLTSPDAHQFVDGQLGILEHAAGVGHVDAVEVELQRLLWNVVMALDVDAGARRVLKQIRAAGDDARQEPPPWQGEIHGVADRGQRVNVARHVHVAGHETVEVGHGVEGEQISACVFGFQVDFERYTAPVRLFEAERIGMAVPVGDDDFVGKLLKRLSSRNACRRAAMSCPGRAARGLIAC